MNLRGLETLTYRIIHDAMRRWLLTQNNLLRD